MIIYLLFCVLTPTTTIRRTIPTRTTTTTKTHTILTTTTIPSPIPPPTTTTTTTGLEAAQQNPPETVLLIDRSCKSVRTLTWLMPLLYLIGFKVNHRRALKFTNALRDNFYAMLKRPPDRKSLERYVRCTPDVLRAEHSAKFSLRGKCISFCLFAQFLWSSI